MTTAAYDITVRRMATGCDYYVRLFAHDVDDACARAKRRVCRTVGISPKDMATLEAKRVAVVRVVECRISEDQSRPAR